MKEYSGSWEPGNIECFSSVGRIFWQLGIREYLVLQFGCKNILAVGNQGILSVTAQMEAYSCIGEPGNECYSLGGRMFW